MMRNLGFCDKRNTTAFGEPNQAGVADGGGLVFISNSRWRVLAEVDAFSDCMIRWRCVSCSIERSDG